jgi:predicted nucleic acid-binding protein
MNGGEDFFDTNVVLYLRSADAAKADRAEELIASGGIISVQVLNEFVAVASRKLRMPWSEIREVLSQLRTVCSIEPISIETHDRAVHIAERHGLSIYDALIVSAALLAGCRTLHSEDMQDGQVIERQLTIRNPFVSSKARHPGR